MGIAVLIMGTAGITTLLIVKEIVYAMRIAVIPAWLLSLLGAVIGGKTRPKPWSTLDSLRIRNYHLWGAFGDHTPSWSPSYLETSRPSFTSCLDCILPFTILLHYYFRNDRDSYQIIFGSMTLSSSSVYSVISITTITAGYRRCCPCAHCFAAFR
jgi:hypothetical protein